MDPNHYSANGANGANGASTTPGASYPSQNVANTTSGASYPSQNAIAPHQLSQHQLPPLQPSHPSHQAMQNPYGSYPHTPRTSSTPNTPVSANNMAAYAPPPQGQQPQQQQNAGRGGYMMQQNPYGQQPQQPQQQPQQQYHPVTSGMVSQTTAAPVHHQPLAPAPSAGGRPVSVLRPGPGPAGGVMSQPGMNSPYGQSPMMQQPLMMPQDGEQPTHVVGSQGRRGVLPSAPGRPPAPAAGTGVTKTQIPQKDADGKFPCPHCTKTYLHAKHLKRHLLRRKSLPPCYPDRSLTSVSRHRRSTLHVLPLP
jgi:hypothetical protein